MIMMLAILALAAIFGAILWYQRNKKKSTAHWPSTRARIVSAEVHRTHDSGGEPTDEPVIGYEYSVDGKIYRGSRVKYGFTPKTKPTLAKYQVGMQVDVF